MFQPTDKLQSRLGIALIIGSTGVSVSLLMGAAVDVSIAGANLSVNRKLQKVERVKAKVEDTVTELKKEPTVSPLKIEGLEAELKEAEVIADDTERQIEDDLNELIDEPEM